MIRSLGKTKPDKLLIDHAEQTSIIAAKLLTPVRMNVFSQLGIDNHAAEQLVKKTTLLHDIGKATVEWQEKAHSEKPPIHSLVSFFGALWALDIKDKERISDADIATVLAILGHHGQMSSRSFQPRNYENQVLNAIPDDWNELVEIATGHHHSLPNSRLSLKHLCRRVDYFKEIIVPQKSECSNMWKLKCIYDLLLTILISADHYASGNVEPWIFDFRSPNIKGGSLTNFQKEVASFMEYKLCAIAGCGSGKTAAALERACILAEKNSIDRIVFCLPTRFTSNSLTHDMFHDYGYAYNEVGLVHSEALQFLESIQIEDDNETTDINDLIQVVGEASRYEKMITISTVDHLLMSCYHGYRHADRAFGNLLTSLVVFDEIHSYETTTLNAINECTQILSACHIPYMYMSATMPSSMRKFFGLTDDQTLIENTNPFRQFIPEWDQNPLTTGRGIHTEITNRCNELLSDAGEIKLAVYVNQVERAKAIAREASKFYNIEDIYCYHSELASVDRSEIEKTVKSVFQRGCPRPAIVIATQAAELSLNICADRMISELAPADTLIQRAGRLNRRGLCAFDEKGNPYQLIITGLTQDMFDNNKSYLPYINPDQLNKTIREAPLKDIFTFQKGIEWCEKVLTDPIPSYSIGLINASIEDTVFGNTPQENYGDQIENPKVSIRDKGDATYLVISESVYNLISNSTLCQITQHQVPIRSWKYHLLNGMGFIENRNINVQKGNKQYTIIIHVVKNNIPYKPKLGGFDFSVLNITDDNPEIQGNFDDIQMY